MYRPPQFSIGLYQLHDDGTQVLDANHEPIPTYDSYDIMSFSRAWTGFALSPFRGNLEGSDGAATQNFVDPMRLKANGDSMAWATVARRDAMPKMNLYDGYLGDGYPLCSRLPPRQFLTTGARYSFLGSSPSPRLHYSRTSEGRLSLRTTSALFARLCDAPNPGEPCRFASDVQLDGPLSCDAGSAECEVDTVGVVQLTSPGSSQAVYYEYHGPACVELAYSSTTMMQLHGGRTCGQCFHEIACADPATFAGGAACCSIPAATVTWPSSVSCRYDEEHMSYETASSRCVAKGEHLCARLQRLGSACALGKGNYIQQWVWQAAACAPAQVQVDSAGLVSIVHPSSTDSKLAVDSQNLFTVRWAGGRFPTAAANCSSAPSCTVHGDTCLCDAVVETVPAFTDHSAVPTAEEVESQLTIGAAPPHAFGPLGTSQYSHCLSPACTAASGVAVFTHAGSSPAGAFDERTIFRIYVNGTTPRHLLNLRSTVSVAGAFSFRNPPSFISMLRQRASDAQHETEALLEHLCIPTGPRTCGLALSLLPHLVSCVRSLVWAVTHQNVGPFLATRLAQRLTTSNPSPRYIKAVSAAFSTGTHGGTAFSGTYGDLGAMAAALLLDPEARSASLDADPTHGALREPLLKLLHLMRAMEFRTSDDSEVELAGLPGEIGQQAYKSDSVFSFFLPEYEAAGPVASANLVSPEAQLATGPFLLGALNSMGSLIRNGLTNCDAGVGSRVQSGSRCDGSDRQIRQAADGVLTFRPSSSGAAAVVSELDLLLTGGRLGTQSRAVMEETYEAVFAQSASHDEALRTVQELFLLAPEWHSTNDNVPRGSSGSRGASVKDGGDGAGSGGTSTSSYKAIVYVFLQGGADSFNLLVPLDGCGSHGDVFARYRAVRGAVAHERSYLLPIRTNGTAQICDVFGMHPTLSTLHAEYQSGDAAFLANVGPLVEPTSKAQYLARSVRTPPGLFAHNVQQKTVQAVHATEENARAKGVLGRMMDALRAGRETQYLTRVYSVGGSAKILEGGERPRFVKPGASLTFRRREALASQLSNLTRLESASVFAETISALLDESVADSIALDAALSASTTHAFSGKLADQLQQVAKVVRARSDLGAERDVFFVSLGAFDTHNHPLSSGKLAQVEAAVRPFVAEMKHLGTWNNVTILVASEFGRTLTSNGKGTDHGWGGHAHILGGAINGTRIVGEYPDTYSSDHSLNAGRGRVIPSMSWESVWHAIGQWFGVEQALMPRVLPNKHRFEGCEGAVGCGLLRAKDLYKAWAVPLSAEY